VFTSVDADAFRLFLQGYAVTPLARMTHQGHSWTTLTCGFTQCDDNNSAKDPIWA